MIHVVMEWNGQDYEDSRTDPIVAYKDKDKAISHVEAFNLSRYEEPIIKSREEWQYDPEHPCTYEDYLQNVEREWFLDKYKRQHVLTLNIIE